MNLSLRIYFAKHFICKLRSTIRVVTCLACARTFGEYEHSAYDTGFSYAKYKWRGKTWFIPTGPVEPLQ